MLTNNFLEFESGELKAPRGIYKEGERGMTASRSKIKVSFTHSRIRQRLELFPSRKCDEHSSGPIQKLALVAGRSKCYRGKVKRVMQEVREARLLVSK